MQQRNVISVNGFCKAYENEIAIDHLDFSVESGQVVGLIGPNGAGKTTTLRCLAGIIPSTRGSLKVCQFDVRESPIEVKKRTAYVPDDPQLFNDLTVQEHFAFVASAYQVDQWHAKMHHLLERFDLSSKIDCRASELSRGMRQKLAICCAYSYDPVALLLDEPMTGLDPRGIRVLKDSILERAQQGTSIILSSHLLAMVEDICSHVLILDKGKKMFAGRFDQLKSQFSHCRNSTLEDIFFNSFKAHESGLPTESF